MSAEFGPVPKQPLSEKDINFYYYEGPDAIKRQYGVGVGAFSELDEHGEPVGYPIDAIISRVTRALPPEIPEVCSQLLEVARTWRGQAHCIKEVHAVAMARLETKRGSRPIAGLGVNGWDPDLVGEKFDWEESKQQMQSEVGRLGLPASPDDVTKVIAEVQRQNPHGTGLSCTQISNTLGKFGRSSDLPHWCRMGLHGNPADRKPNDTCPSSWYCAEGSARNGLAKGLFIAKLFPDMPVTVIDSRPIGMGRTAVRFMLDEPISGTSNGVVPSILIYHSDRHSELQDTIAHAAGFDFQPQDFIPDPRIGAIIQADFYSSGTTRGTLATACAPGTDLDAFFDGVHVMKEEREAHHVDPDAQSIKDTIWISTYPPCANCAVNLGRRRMPWVLRAFNDGGVEVLFFERFSRHAEKIDAGDIMPLASFLWRGADAVRFGQDLPAPTWRE